MTLASLVLLWSSLSAAGLGASAWMLARSWVEMHRERRPPREPAARPGASRAAG